MIGIEYDKSRYEFSKKKKLNVFHIDALTEEIPEADVYFMCIAKEMWQPILENLRKSGRQGSLLIRRAREDDWNMAFPFKGRKQYLKLMTI